MRMYVESCSYTDVSVCGSDCNSYCHGIDAATIYKDFSLCKYLHTTHRMWYRLPAVHFGPQPAAKSVRTMEEAAAVRMAG